MESLRFRPGRTLRFALGEQPRPTGPRPDHRCSHDIASRRCGPVWESAVRARRDGRCGWERGDNSGDLDPQERPAAPVSHATHRCRTMRSSPTAPGQRAPANGTRPTAPATRPRPKPTVSRRAVVEHLPRDLRHCDRPALPVQSRVSVARAPGGLGLSPGLPVAGTGPSVELGAGMEGAGLAGVRATSGRPRLTTHSIA